jgi:chloramphenicol O-acetyltransferase type B
MRGFAIWRNSGVARGGAGRERMAGGDAMRGQYRATWSEEHWLFYAGMLVLTRMLVPRWIRLDKVIRRTLATAAVRLQAKSCGPGLRVSGWSHATANTVLGRNVNWNGLRILGAGNVSIGDNFHSGEDCLLICQNHDFDSGEAIPYGSGFIPKDIVIEDNVWLGARVVVLGGVRIAEGAIIQAGSCVVNDIPRCAIAGGHPARVFRSRDVAHYERLKREGRFH